MTAGNSLSVWDLGYVSTVECKLVASVGLGDDVEFWKFSFNNDLIKYLQQHLTKLAVDGVLLEI